MSFRDNLKAQADSTQAELKQVDFQLLEQQWVSECRQWAEKQLVKIKAALEAEVQAGRIQERRRQEGRFKSRMITTREVFYTTREHPFLNREPLCPELLVQHRILLFQRYLSSSKKRGNRLVPPSNYWDPHEALRFV